MALSVLAALGKSKPQMAPPSGACMAVEYPKHLQYISMHETMRLNSHSRRGKTTSLPLTNRAESLISVRGLKLRPHKDETLDLSMQSPFSPQDPLDHQGRLLDSVGFIISSLD